MRNELQAAEAQVETARISPQRAFYLPQLDGLRFFAFFLVFLHHNVPTSEKVVQHAGPIFQAVLIVFRDTTGFGLSLFFLLSSYLISSLLLLERDATGKIDLRAFYVRRVLRIWPLYFIFLGAVSCVGIWLPAEHMSAARLATMCLLAGNWYSIAAGMGPFVIAPLWSISVEEQFYAIWPGIFRIMPKRSFVYFSICLGTVSLVSIFVFASYGVGSLNIWMNSLSEFVFFSVGALLAILINPNRKPDRRYSLLLTAAGLFLWLIADVLCGVRDVAHHISPALLAFGYLLAAVGCALVLIGCLYFPAGSVPGWLKYLGKISYGLYVFHALAMHLMRVSPAAWHLQLPGIEFVVILSITVVLAALSYEAIEKPFLRMKRRFELIVTRSA